MLIITPPHTTQQCRRAPKPPPRGIAGANHIKLLDAHQYGVGAEFWPVGGPPAVPALVFQVSQLWAGLTIQLHQIGILVLTHITSHEHPINILC